MQSARYGPKHKTSLSGMLADIADELSSIRDWRTRVFSVLCLISDRYPSSTASVGLQMSEWEVISCARGPDLEAIEEPLRRAYSMLVTPPRTFPAAEPALKETIQGTGSCITIPVIGAAGTIGVLNAHSLLEHAFSADDFASVSTAAMMIGSFAQNVLGHEEEVRAREKIEHMASQLTEHVHLLQQALVPRRPMAVEGYRVASAFIAGGEGAEVGGDFYDVFDTRDGRIGVIIGDVTGRGIPSASLAVATRSTVRAYAYESSCPATALTFANSMLYSSDPMSGLFVTVFVTTLDPSSGHLTYSSAGHPFPIVRRKDSGETECLTFGGPPVGIMSHLEYQPQESHLDPGDKIIFYTDGISEARHDGRELGMDGVERLVRERGDLPPEDLVQALLSEARAWSQGRLADDIALIVLERNAD